MARCSLHWWSLRSFWAQKATCLASSSAMQRRWLLRRLQLLKLDCDMILDFYLKYIRPLTEHGVVVWNSGLTNAQINELGKNQKIAFKIILANDYISFWSGLHQSVPSWSSFLESSSFWCWASGSSSSSNFLKNFKQARAQARTFLGISSRLKLELVLIKRFRAISSSNSKLSKMSSKLELSLYLGMRNYNLEKFKDKQHGKK